MNDGQSAFRLENKTVAIVGAGGGLGTACVRLCRASGARIVPCGRNAERLLPLAEAGLEPAVVDMQLPEAFETWATALPMLDGLVFASGIALSRPFSMTDASHWEQIMQVNVTGPMLASRAVLRAKRLNRGGSVVFIGSIAALRGAVGYTAYSASKGALLAGTRGLALELAPKGFRANVLSPGLIATPMVIELARQQTQVEANRYNARYPLGPGTPEDVAQAVRFLVSDASRWMTGQNLVLDGGVTLA